ncbi:MAG: GTPase HflX [Nitrososphaeria archaeon]
MERAVLVTYPDPYCIKEAVALANTAGYEIVGIITQKYLLRSKYGLGAGKLNELLNMIKNEKVDKIIFDESLKTSQAYNLAKVLKKEVIDREKLILQIFSKRASTLEAKLQIKLAELKYELMRAREKVRLEKMGEQPGFYGLGEYEVDVYVNQIKREINFLNKKLEDIKRQRTIQRKGREEKGLLMISLAGYTGAGKTSLFNYLTGETLYVSDQIFSTLRTTTRKILNEKNILISDTVGFIRKIPPYMIEAFKSTLEELKFADLILLVIDASEAIEEIQMKFDTSYNILLDLEIDPLNIVIVFNKLDLISEEKVESIKKVFDNKEIEYYFVSAKTGNGVNILLEKIRKKLMEEEKTYFLDFKILPKISNEIDSLKKVCEVKVEKLEDQLKLKVKGGKTILRRFENQLEYARRNFCAKDRTSNRQG